MAVNLSALLARKADEIEKPKPLPVGHYRFGVVKYEAAESSQKKTPGVTFYVRPSEAMEDVDQGELDLIKEPFKKEMKLTFWITEDSLWRLVEFLKILGMATEGRELIELITEAQGSEFLAAIEHAQSQNNPEEVYASLKESSFSAVE